MNKQLLKTFKNKNILVTGGTGSIGSEIVKQLIEYKPKQIRIYSRDETKQFFLQKETELLKPKTDIRYLIGDIRDKDRLDMAFGNINIVFHAAALKHVPFCEYNPFEAIKTNIYGTQNVIDMSIKHKVAKVIAVSTDKAVNPINIMGSTKLLMEKMTLSTRWYLGKSNTKFSIVRFGNVLNSRGSVVQLWNKQLHNNQPMTITHPSMTRYFISIKDAVNLILRAAQLMKGQEIFILKMPKIKIIDLAKKTNKKINGNKKITIKFTGKREGEKITEQLFTHEELQNIFEFKDMYIVIPYSDIYAKRNKRIYLNAS